MWRCDTCNNEIEDKYLHCWQCGTIHMQPQPTKRSESSQQVSVPGFASYEEMAKVPSKPMWFFRRGPLQRLFFLVLILALLKIFSSPLLGTYGNYVVAAVGVILLVGILWRFFRRDPAEGVGIKLH